MEQANYKIVADGEDITGLIRDRFISLSVTDAPGEASDTMTLELDNRDQRLPLPATGAALQVWIGMGESLVFKGNYQVSELEEPLEEDVLTIHGKAAKMKGSLKAPRNASYDKITLQALVDQIAQRHGYTPKVSADFAAHRFEHIDQNAESDMSLLTRLARDLGAIVKPVADHLIVVKRGESRSVSGQALPVITIADPQNSKGRVAIQERDDYQSVVAQWFDESAQKKVSVTAGEGAPVYTMRGQYSDAATATAAARSKLGQLQRGKRTLDLDRPLAAEIVPDCTVNLVNHKASANGAWLADQVTHTIRSGEIGNTTVQLLTPG
ncbi:contractile injection system protein, VgrG/Pvc8 family [Pontibacterium sp.]|uniref:contractile injection system protein, VgrG/Pvc8 family n=1 Tax=Pontibacterium sp. TaxID=2036026 RepID=UPI0035642E69